MATQPSSKKSGTPSGATGSKPRAARATAAKSTTKAGAGTTVPIPSGNRANNRAENAMNRILLVDLGERELKAREKLRKERQRLKTIDDTKRSSGGLSVDQKRELKRIEELLSSDVTVDPFYQVVASTYLQRSWADLVRENTYVHEYGLLGSQRLNGNLRKTLDRKSGERELIGICGLMQIDGLVEPGHRGFIQKISAAQGEYRQNRALFDAAFNLLSNRYPVKLESQVRARLIDEQIYGCVRPGGNPESRPSTRDVEPRPEDTVDVLSGRNLAAAVRKLAADGISADDPWLASRIQNTYEMQSGVVGGAPPSSFDIPLPDLDEATDVEIVRENLDAAQAIYFAYQLEEAHLPQVVERIVDLFRAGLLPLSYGKSGDYLYGYYRKAGERITEAERRDLYMRAFGAPGGDPSINQPNREFNELWLRLISAVSSFGRQLSYDRIFRSPVPMNVSQEQVRKAARDLAASLSRSCYGIAYQFSKELKTLIVEYRDLLSDHEIRGAFGARDMWQVIDQVNSNYLGGARNSHRYRTQAKAGAVIIAWLRNNHTRLNGGYGEVIEVNALTNPQLRGSDRPMEQPTDWDLLQACEQWLAVGGVQDQRIEEYSQPIESPTITSKPIPMPQVARDVLDSAGIELPTF